MDGCTGSFGGLEAFPVCSSVASRTGATIVVSTNLLHRFDQCNLQKVVRKAFPLIYE